MESVHPGHARPHELDSQRKGGGRIDVIVAIDLLVNRAGPEDMRLQRYLDGDRLFGRHEDLPPVQPGVQ